MRRAVVLFNLGGPDNPDAIRPFLENLFGDPAILRIPRFLRGLLARLIARKRTPKAMKIYARLGGASPLLPQTKSQAAALETELSRDEGTETKVFVAMRHWHPRASEVVRAVKAFGPDETVLVPLSPQFSTTTAGSWIADWRIAAHVEGLSCVERAVCCHFLDENFVKAHADMIRKTCQASERPVRILFSAHGLPQKIVEAGDPYQSHVERTVAAVVRKLDDKTCDHVICYQSRVGPLRWLGPSTLDAVEEAGNEGVSVVVVPISFVSEHVETLVELDEEVREAALRAGVPSYARVPALGVHPLYIRALAGLVKGAVAGTGPPGGKRLCSHKFRDCPVS